MNEHEQYTLVCKPQLDRIERKLDFLQSLDIRVDRNTQSLGMLRRVTWTLFGATVSGGVAIVVTILSNL